MNNKVLITLSLCISALVSCSQNSQPQKIVFNPNDSLKYQITLNSKILQLDIIVEGAFKKKPDTIYATWTIKKMEYEDSSDLGKEINQDYQQYINNTLTSVLNNRGKIIKNTSSSNIINTDILVADLPSSEIKLNDTWTGKKSAEPDMIYDSIRVKYTCTKITQEETTLKVQMDFLQKVNPKNNPLYFTKRYNGYYILDNKTGTVKNAKLEMSGFNGFSKITGQIEIKELHE